MNRLHYYSSDEMGRPSVLRNTADSHCLPRHRTGRNGNSVGDFSFCGVLPIGAAAALFS